MSEHIGSDPLSQERHLNKELAIRLLISEIPPEALRLITVAYNNGELLAANARQFMQYVAVEVKDAESEDLRAAAERYLEWERLDYEAAEIDNALLFSVLFPSAQKNEISDLVEKLLNDNPNHWIDSSVWDALYVLLEEASPEIRERIDKWLSGVCQSRGGNGKYFQDISNPDAELPTSAFVVIGALGRLDIVDELVAQKKSKQAAKGIAYGYGLAGDEGKALMPLLLLVVGAWGDKNLEEEVRQAYLAGLSSQQLTVTPE